MLIAAAIEMNGHTFILSLLLAGCFSDAFGEGLTPTEQLALGDKAMKSRDLQAAIERYEEGIALLGLGGGDDLATEIALYTNLGSARSLAGDDHSAVSDYRKAILAHSEKISQHDGDENSHRDATNLAAKSAFYLGTTHFNIDNMQEAANAYAFANTLDPFHWAAVANLGSLLQDHLEEPAEALAAYNKAYEILTQNSAEPTDPPENSRAVLSQIQYRVGNTINSAMGHRKCAVTDDPTKQVPCLEMAAHAFSLAIEYDETNENAKHMLAAVTADGSMSRASTEYVAQLFEDYAENFEHSLVQELGYNGFERLRQVFDRAFDGSKIPMFDLVVDAGCGTGLTGEQFRNVSSHLLGVDLSPSIIEEAEKARPGLYDEIQVGDVTETFRKRKPIDLIIAGDSYIYFGDLDSLFASMNEGLKSGGYVAFTLENASEDNEKSLAVSKPDWRWQLTPSGRFAHHKRYVESVAKRHGMDVVRYETLDAFRLEKGLPVRGHSFILRKVA